MGRSSKRDCFIDTTFMIDDKDFVNFDDHHEHHDNSNNSNSNNNRKIIVRRLFDLVR